MMLELSVTKLSVENFVAISLCRRSLSKTEVKPSLVENTKNQLVQVIFYTMIYHRYCWDILFFHDCIFFKLGSYLVSTTSEQSCDVHYSDFAQIDIGPKKNLAIITNIATLAHEWPLSKLRIRIFCKVDKIWQTIFRLEKYSYKTAIFI